VSLGVDDSLPPRWASTLLGEACLINPRGHVRAPHDDTLVSFVPMAAVEAGTGRVDVGQTKRYKDVRQGYTRFSDGDVLFAKITPCMENGKIAVVTGLRNGLGAGSTEFHVLRPIAGISEKLVMYYVSMDEFRRAARQVMTGTAGQLRVPQRFVEGAPFPLAPLPEQYRIVAEIEKQLTRLDAAIAALNRARAKLKRYRASVLKAACEGRLVPTEAELARREGRSYESASVLLDRVLKERRSRWEAEQRERNHGRGGRLDEGEPKRSRRILGEPAGKLMTLPEGWVGTSLLTIAELKGGVTKGQKHKPGVRLREVPYLRVANVQRGYLDLREVKTIKARVEDVRDLALRPGDVLFNEGGDRDKLGRGWVWSGEISECIHQNHVFRARLCGADIQPKFVSWYGNSFGQAYFIGEGKQTTNLASINMTKLAALPIPLPPTREQERIVDEVEHRLSLLDALELAVESNLKRSERLRQAILKHAFEGKLAPQDPTDESASVLLDRIKAERASLEGDSDRCKPARRRPAGRKGKAVGREVRT